jgi:hypothetical protein
MEDRRPDPLKVGELLEPSTGCGHRSTHPDTKMNSFYASSAAAYS